MRRLVDLCSLEAKSAQKPPPPASLACLQQLAVNVLGALCKVQPRARWQLRIIAMTLEVDDPPAVSRLRRVLVSIAEDVPPGERAGSSSAANCAAEAIRVLDGSDGSFEADAVAASTESMAMVEEAFHKLGAEAVASGRMTQRRLGSILTELMDVTTSLAPSLPSGRATPGMSYAATRWFLDAVILPTGTAVRVTGVTSKPHLNGCAAVIAAPHCMGNGGLRYPIRMLSGSEAGTLLGLKPANITVLSQKAAKAVANAAVAAEAREAKKAEEPEAAMGDTSAPPEGPLDPSTGQPLVKNAEGAYMIGHLAGPDGRVNTWDIPGAGLDDVFDTAMNVRMPTEEMMRTVERQRQLDPTFDPVAAIERLGIQGFMRQYVNAAEDESQATRATTSSALPRAPAPAPPSPPPLPPPLRPTPRAKPSVTEPLATYYYADPGSSAEEPTAESPVVDSASSPPETAADAAIRSLLASSDATLMDVRTALEHYGSDASGEVVAELKRRRDRLKKKQKKKERRQQGESSAQEAAVADSQQPPDDSEPPDEYVCPITQDVMIDPVIAADGHTYERAAIARWFEAGKRTSPKTGGELESTALLPNHLVRRLVLEWRESHGS